MLPSPDNPRSAPIWENYIVAQTVQSALGTIPDHALALGVDVVGTQVCLCFQLSDASDQDLVDIEDIRSGLQDLVGQDVEVRSRYEIVPQRQMSPVDGVRWVYLARERSS